MNTDEMIAVTALIRPQLEDRIVKALHDLPEFPGFFLIDARGQGRGRGEGGSYMPADYDFTYHRFLELRIVCRTDLASLIADTIAKAAWTGRVGDGIVYTTPIQSFVRIREAGAPSVKVSP